MEEQERDFELPMKKPAADLNGEAGQTGRQFVEIRENSWAEEWVRLEEGKEWGES